MRMSSEGEFTSKGVLILTPDDFLKTNILLLNTSHLIIKEKPKQESNLSVI